MSLPCTNGQYKITRRRRRHLYIAEEHRSERRLRNVVFTSAKEVMFSSLFVCLLATLRKSIGRDLHEIFREGWRWANEQMVKFW